MSLLAKIGFIGIFLFSFIFASWYVSHGDITFSADIARDFHLLREVDQKKIVFIGPRSSTGLFHGPLWTYLNYPAFLIGKGDPVVVGWYWVFLSILFVISNFFIAKDLFGKLSAYFFAAFTAVYVSYHTLGMYNPHGALFFAPLFFYLFIKYIKTRRFLYLILHLITGGMILQFQLAIGVPFLILSIPVLVYIAIKKHKKNHLLAFLILPILVSNFILFDMRHEHMYTQKIMSFITPQQDGKYYNYATLIQDRINIALSSTEILRHDAYGGYLNLIFFITLLVLLILLIRKKVHRDIYFSFLYFYFGFFVLSFINKGPVLYFYIFPLFPLTFLMLSSLMDTKFKNYFIIPLLLILIINMLNALQDIQYSSKFIGKNINSWKFLESAAKNIKKEKKDFGYFVFTPDLFAYEPKYAMIYISEKYHIGHYYKKLPVTYVFSAPTPKNTPFVTGDAWWIRNKLGIEGKPTNVITFPNGYKLQRFELTQKEMNVPFDPSTDLGIHFR